MKRSDLTVCDKCGWYEHGRFSLPMECDPEKGAMVDRLAASISVPTTKLGYGTGNFAIKFGENFTLQMRPTSRIGIDGDCYSVQRLFMLQGLTHADAVDLIETLTRWRDRTHRRHHPGER